MELEAKLIKRGDSNYTLHLVGDPLENIPRAVYPWDITKSRLNLKNCQAIERGYDLDELAEKEAKKLHDWDKHSDNDIYNQCVYEDSQIIKIGFQKALELLGDNKYSENNLLQAIEMYYGESKTFVEVIQSLQKTEWDVILDTSLTDKD